MKVRRQERINEKVRQLYIWCNCAVLSAEMCINSSPTDIFNGGVVTWSITRIVSLMHADSTTW